MVLSGGRKQQLLAAAGQIKVDALVIDLDLPGERWEAVLGAPDRGFKRWLSLIVSGFAKRDTIEPLRGPRRQLLRALVSARAALEHDRLDCRALGEHACSGCRSRRGNVDAAAESTAPSVRGTS